MMRLVATRSFTYARRSLRPGDIFTASTTDGKALIIVRRAKQAPPELEQPAQVLPPPPPPAPARAVPRQAPDPPATPAPPPVPAARAAPPPAVPVPAVDPEQVLSALRTRLQALGITPDGRWGEARLREEIATAQAARYQTRQMRPQE